MSKCVDCGINEAGDEDLCQECFDNNTVEISDYIPIGEIEKVIAQLERSSTVCMRINNHDKADAYNSAIYLLKELLSKNEA